MHKTEPKCKLHIGTVPKRIQGASRRVRRRFESRLGHFLSRTQTCPELDGMFRNQVRSGSFPVPPLSKYRVLYLFYVLLRLNA